MIIVGMLGGILTMKEQIVSGKMREILGRGIGINLFFALKNKDGSISIKKGDLESGDTQNHLLKSFSDLLKDDFLQEELQIISISGADERNNALYYYDMDDFPESLNYFKNFEYPNEYQKLNYENDDWKNIDALLIVIGNQEHHCILYKKFYPIFLLGRGSFCLIKSNKRLKEFDEELIRISTDYQFIRIDEDIIIKDIKVLEKFGGFRTVIENEAELAIDTISDLDILDEVEILKETMKDDLSFARRLVKVKRTSPVIAKKIPNLSIIEFSKTHPGLVNQFKYNDDKILLTTKKSQKCFLKMLEDSYLTSELTKLYYDSLAKEMLEMGA